MKKQSGKKFNSKFRAHRVETPLNWDDLVLAKQTLHQVNELKTWLQHGDVLLDDWGMRGKIKPGFRALFQGPSGTGKTTVAGLLGKSTGKEVYSVALSAIVSKYIGETEKNLDKLFAKAERDNWILFFDEADALFGKRTQVGDAHDKYANQEVAYLLQRLSAYSGLAILAGDFQEGIDDAILRHFQSVIAFPAPDPAARLRLWTNAFPKKATLEAEADLKNVAEKYELNQAAIMNVVQFCCLRALERGTHSIRMQDVDLGIRNELSKGAKPHR